VQRASYAVRRAGNPAGSQTQDARDDHDQASTSSSATLSQEALRLQRQLYFEVGRELVSNLRCCTVVHVRQHSSASPDVWHYYLSRRPSTFAIDYRASTDKREMGAESSLVLPHGSAATGGDRSFCSR
jgi:hypothetical protein